MHTTDAN